MTLAMPQYLIGIGGGGCSIVENIMSRDWVIQDLVEQEADDGAGMRAITIDSANSGPERNRRSNPEEDIIDSIDSTRENYEIMVEDDLDLEEYSNVSFRHYNYVESTESSEMRTRSLVRRQDVQPNILDNTDRLSDSWWLEEDTNRELLTDGFSNGVKRIRALSKALYHVSSIHGKNTSQHPQELNVSSGDHVVMIVALGGGTGSGSFIDLARDMPNDANIHLFGIIPDAGIGGGQSEGGDELSSAHATLSELEYMQLTGESSFHNITLIPWLERSDTKEVDFEDAVAHTVFSYVKLIIDQNADNTLIPGRNNAINKMHPFNIAVPRVIRYDVGMRAEASEDVEEFLEERDSELDIEEGLYDAVRTYIKNNFEEKVFNRYLDSENPGSRPPVEFGTDQQTDEQLQAMARRLEEQLQGTLLTDETLRTAGLEDAVDTVTEAFAEVYATQFNSVDGDEVDDDEGNPIYEHVDQNRSKSNYAREIIKQLTTQTPNLLDTGEFEGSEQEKRFVQLVLDELKNIKERFDLLRAVHRVRPDQFDILEPQQVKDIKTALTQVALSSDTRNLFSEFGDQQNIRAIQADLWRKLSEAELAYAQMEQLESEVTQTLRELFGEWEEAVESELQVIIEYHRKYNTIKTSLNQLNDACENKARDLSSEKTQAQYIDRSLENDDGSVNIRELNNNLEAVGVGRLIEKKNLYNDISNLISAKESHEDYHSGFNLFGGDGDIQQFKRHKSSVEMGSKSRFEITTDIENTFNVDYKYDYTNILKQLDERYTTAVETVRRELKEQLTDDQNMLISHSVRQQVDQETVVDKVTQHGSVETPKQYFESSYYGGDEYIDNNGYIEFRVPQDEQQVRNKMEELETTLKEIETGSIDSKMSLKSKLGFEEEFTVTKNSPVEQEMLESTDGVLKSVFELYLGPVWSKQKEFESKLEQLGSEYIIEDTDGLYQAVSRLIRLADMSNQGDSPVSDGMTLQVTDPKTYYGSDFYSEYNRENHEVSMERERHSGQSSGGRNNPLLRTNSAKKRDLTGAPNDIAESNIWSGNKSEILPAFERSIEDLANGRYSRLPVDLKKLEPPENSPAQSNFKELRMLNVFLSRSFDEEPPSPSGGFDKIKDKSKHHDNLNPLLNDNNGYLAAKYSKGDDWTLSIVTFLSGFTLDMLEPVTTGDGGYAETYEKKRQSLMRPWRNHNLGLAGLWDEWEKFDDRVDESDRPYCYPDAGGYLWRSETDTPGEMCARTWKLLNEEDVSKDDIVEEMLSNYEYRMFPSTIHRT